MSQVEILTKKDYQKAARTLYESFDDDDVARFTSNHLKDDPELRLKVDLMLYECYVYSFMLKGLVVGIRGENHENEDTFESVALWATPDGGDFSADPLCMLRSGWLKFAWMTGADGRRRVFKEMFSVLHDNEVDILGPETLNVYTLVYLGSTPKARGKGNVRKIFDYMYTQFINKENALCYLESSNTVNVPIYKKFGFEPVRDIWLGSLEDKEDSAMMTVMIRGRNGAPWPRIEEVRQSSNYKL